MKSPALLLAALAALALAGCDRVTPENAAKLKPGMPESEVKAVLGDRVTGWSGGPTDRGRQLSSYTYQTDRLWVMVKCEDGKIAQVFTRDPARKVPIPARIAMPVLDLSVDGPAAPLAARGPWSLGCDANSCPAGRSFPASASR